MPGHFVGGYLAWAETVPGSILIDKQFRGLCTTAWAQSQVLFSLLEKITGNLRKLQGFATFWGPGRACHPKADAMGKMAFQAGQVVRNSLSSIWPTVFLFRWDL